MSISVKTGMGQVAMGEQDKVYGGRESAYIASALIIVKATQEWHVLAQGVAIFVPMKSLVIQVVFCKCRRRLFRTPVWRAAVKQDAYIVDLK